MTTVMPEQTLTAAPPPTADELADRGWRTAIVSRPDGTETFEKMPLTPEEFLHPEEGYRLPNSTFHETTCGDAKDLLDRRYANDPTAGVFRDLLIEWDTPGLTKNSPDVFVAFGIEDKESNRRRFNVTRENARPALIIEVVSPEYRKQDREGKVEEYELAGVLEYVILDRVERRRQVSDEVIGYRLVRGRYRLITPDDQGRILCQTVGVWISLQDGQLVMEDAETGERLLTAQELDAARQAAEAQARAEQAAREAAEAKAADLAGQLQAAQAELERLRRRDNP